jgi:tartrate/fumarate subfamily iron-sulfur-dependent hydro-lyase beta chain
MELQRMNETHLNIPLNSTDVLNLRLGDLVYLSGAVFTARSLFHIRAIERNVLPPIDFKALNVMVHMGPMMRKQGKGWHAVSCDPTTSMRFEKYAAQVIPRLSLRALVGKGGMGPATAQAMQRFGCVHLAKIGIYGNMLASKVTRVLGVYNLEELGPVECTWVMEVEKFGPFFVDIDSQGRSFFEHVKDATRDRLQAVYRSLSISPAK